MEEKAAWRPYCWDERAGLVKEGSWGCKLESGDGRTRTHPLGLELFASHGFGEGIFKHAVVGPELQLLQRWSSRE